MNRALLLMFADFLIVSFLTLAKFEEVPSVAQQSSAVAESAQSNKDLIEVLQMSLEQERLSREELSSDLNKTKSELDKTKEDSVAKLEELKALKEKKEELEAINKNLQITAELKNKLEEEYYATRKRLDDAQEERLAMTKNLSEAKQESAVSAERLRLLQEKLREQETHYKAVAEKFEKLSSEFRISELEKQKLETSLQVAHTEKTMLNQNLSEVKSDMQVLSNDKARAEQHAQTLAYGLSSLAENSGLLHEELQKLQPMNINKIFDIYRENRVEVAFASKEKVLLGEQSRNHKANAVVVSDSVHAYVLICEELTPFVHKSLSEVRGKIIYREHSMDISEVALLASDSRVIAIPVDMKWVEEKGIKPFTLSSDPLRFSSSVSVTQNDKFGDVLLKQHPQYPEFFKRETAILTGLPGEVNTKRGDLIFAKTGHFMGVMINDDYMVLVEKLKTTNQLVIGKDFKADEFARIKSEQEKTRQSLLRELR